MMEIVNQSEQKRDKETPYAIYFKTFALYNSKFFKDAKAVVLFEYLLMQGDMFLKHRKLNAFYHTAKQIKAGTLISESAQLTIIEKFIKAGFLTKTVRGVPQKSYYQIHFDWLIQHAPKIYHPTIVAERQRHFRELLLMYQP